MTDLSPSPGADEDLWTTAVHEAGHVMHAIAHGLQVEAVDVISTAERLGATWTRMLPFPTEDDCQPGARWIELAIKQSLAGDRAVRRIDPNLETATGGPSSDYRRANAYLQAVFPSDEVDEQLDRCCGELDAFFSVPAVLEEVRKIAAELIERRTLTGTEVRSLVTGDRCGAFSTDFTRRCEGSPHDPRADHYSVVSGPTGHARIEWSYLELSRDRTPKSKRSARSKRVLRVYQPRLYGPPRRDPIVEDLPGLLSIIENPATSHSTRRKAQRKLDALLAARARETIKHSLPPPGQASKQRDLLRQHTDECGESVEPDADGDYWCGSCGFEILNPDRTRHPRRIYQIVEWQIARPVGAPSEDFRMVPRATAMTFSTAKEAQTYLRLARPESPASGAIRLPLPTSPKTPSRKPNP